MSTDYRRLYVRHLYGPDSAENLYPSEAAAVDAVAEAAFRAGREAAARDIEAVIADGMDAHMRVDLKLAARLARGAEVATGPAPAAGTEVDR